MDLEVKTKWIESLRSGEYKQGRGRLRGELNGEVKYCCLGVVCDILNVGKWNSLSEFEYAGQPRVSYPNTEFLELIDLKYDEAKNLAYLNDQLGWSFKKIANWIEESL